MNRIFIQQRLFNNSNRLDILDVMVDYRQCAQVQALSDKLKFLELAGRGGGESLGAEQEIQNIDDYL